MVSETAPAAAQPPSPGPSSLHWLARLARATASGVLALGLAMLGALAYALGSTDAARWLADRVSVASQGRLSIESLSGSLWSGLQAERIVWRDASMDLQIEGARLRPDWRGLLLGEVVISELSARHTRAVLGPTASRTADPVRPQWPELALPMTYRLEVLQMNRIELSGAALGVGAPWVIDRLEASADYRPGRLRVERLFALSQGVELGATALELSDLAPHRLSGHIRLNAPSAVLAGWLGIEGPADPAPPPMLHIDLSGTLEAVEAQLQAGAWGASAHARLSLAPLAIDAPLRLEGSFEQLELRALMPKGPQARLDGRFSYALPAQTFELSLRQEKPLPLERQGLPLVGAHLVGALAGPIVRIDRLAIDLRESVSGAAGAADRSRVTGKLQIDRTEPVVAGPWRFPALTGELSVSHLDLKSLTADWPTTRASGRIVLEPRRLSARLSDTGLTTDPLTLQAEIGIEQAELRIDEAGLTLGPAHASARGRVSLIDQGRVELAGHLARIDSAWLSAWLPDGVVLPPAEFGAQWQVSRRPLPGSTPGPVPLALALTLDPASRLAGVELTGTARAEFLPGRIRAVDLRLAQRADRLSATGALGGAEDRLTIAARLGDLARFLPQVTGPVRLEGELVGRLDAPEIKLALSAGPIEVPQAPPTLAPLGLVLNLALQGTAADHVLELNLRAREEALRLSGRGTLPELARATTAGAAPVRWRATIDRLQLSGSLPARLERPAQLALGAAGSVELSELALLLERGRISLEALRWQNGVLTSSGQVTAVSLAPFADRLEARGGLAQPEGSAREALARLRALQVSGRWDLSGETWQRATGELAFEVQRADGINATAKAVDPVVGESRLRLRLRQGALSGEARLTVPSLAFTRPLTAPDWVAEGSLAFDGRVAGTVERPELDGQMKGEGLLLINRSLGWRLREGRLAARLQGRVLRIDSLRFLSGERGVVELTGDIEPLADERQATTKLPSGTAQRAPFDADLSLRLERFIVPLPPGQRLVLSGQTRLLARKGQVSWTGMVSADEGLIEFGNLSAPELPTDLVILDRRVAPGAAPARSTAQATEARANGEGADAGWMPSVDGDLRIALGERLRVQGSGLDARLTGELALAGRLPREPRVSGRVQLRDGTFQAYGRKLDLTRGELRFGGEVDNPFIDIVALRRHQEVSAGVSVTGPARSPRVRLVSEPDLPDAQKLSWLVLGTGLEDAAAAGQALALREAALNLLGEDDGGLVGGLSQALGLDSVSFGRSVAASRDSLGTARLGLPGLAVPGATTGGSSTPGAGSVRQEVVSVSKRLNSRLTLSYERGLQGLWNLVRLQYEISNRLLLRAQSGSENAVDLLYFWWFD